jgi:hypothetical protein
VCLFKRPLPSRRHVSYTSSRQIIRPAEQRTTPANVILHVGVRSNYTRKKKNCLKTFRFGFYSLSCVFVFLLLVFCFFGFHDNYYRPAVTSQLWGAMIAARNIMSRYYTRCILCICIQSNCVCDGDCIMSYCAAAGAVGAILYKDWAGGVAGVAVGVKSVSSSHRRRTQ